MSSVTVKLIQGVDKDVDLLAVQDDGTPIDLTSATLIETIRNGDGDVVLTKNPRITDPINGRYTLSFKAIDTARLQLGTYLHDVKASWPPSTTLSIIDPSFFVVTLGGVTSTPPPAFSNTVSIDQNWELSDSLRYMDAGGNPIDAAQIRVYLKSDYDAGNLAAPVGSTLTTADGRWKDPVLVIPGYTYVVRFEAPNRFGPDTATITV